MPDVAKILQDIEREDGRYYFEDFGTQRNNASVYVMARSIYIYGKHETFEVNINVFPHRNSLHIIMPLYEHGFYGDDSGAFYQLMGELSNGIEGNAQIVPYSLDQSNQPVIKLSEYLNRVDKEWFRDTLEYLYDLYIYIKPILDVAVTRLRLISDPQARIKSNHYKLLNDLQRLLNDSD
jgi:spore coat protein CotH